ncbi:MULTISPECIES: Pls/PosA family non-ribosomal peptide synthetase [unclassified Beijerinckia]|uniref:Pls/PosA family non-ribosomal peptide synthetase n=1 Tax=unclassified Beijerinckia TaxID=2638183 RepID=UPI001FCDBCE4|nr:MULTISPECIES: Pls/PosA family non-ribosomal peptide synthetase [unclassified Beijerinckia]MDH7797397.1 non-ribosomal peptide synthetase-like protein [Beijerinckia sp. GAS462]
MDMESAQRPSDTLALDAERAPASAVTGAEPTTTATAGSAVLSITPSVTLGPVRPDLLRNELLGELFAASAHEHPTRTCLIADGHKLTYRDVDRAAERLARGLLHHGAKPGAVVGLWMGRGADLLIAQIAITRTGAAFLPFDADVPAERVAECLADCGASALFTDPERKTRLAGLAADAILCPALTSAEIGSDETADIVSARALGCTPDDPAYLIYTSGSTGKPKGIVVTQRNICHYLRAANEIYGLTADDVVFQGASVAFDLSMEEIWVPYLVGATLFVATPQIMGETERLPDLMEANGITVLDTVPTLLAMLPRDINTLRIIILGGEACPPIIAEHWCKPGRRVFNSYGPTETTVVATIAEVHAGTPVTIGKPIPNYTCYVVDDELLIVPPGVEGELLIGGPGVARGYLNRDELTAEKFIANPFDSQANDARLYRSGDAVLLDDNGEIVFRGRIDDQVKIRGFRVELGEIEAKLVHRDEIAQTAVVLQNHDGVDQLIAFIVPERGATIDAKALRQDLQRVLPAYMIPARFEVLSELPRLSSGKADRNRLKKIELAPLTVAPDEQEEPATPTEAVLLDAAREVLPPQPIGFEADFFTDLGGHSLLAAKFISFVRRTPQLASITLQDVYAARTLRSMGEILDQRVRLAPPARDLTFTPSPLLRRFLCGLAQACVLPFILAVTTAQWLGVFVSYMLLTSASATLFEEIFSLLAVYACINVATVFLAIAIKWIALGRTKPGRYPLWGTYYFRWWVAQRFLALTHMKYFQSSPVMRFYLRALGARVGDDAIIAEIEAGAPDLLNIGDGCSIGGKVKFANARVEGNELIIGTIDIGADAYIGTSCVIENDTKIGAHAELHDLTAIAAGTEIGEAEIWDGSPGRRIGAVNVAALEAPAQASALRRGTFGVLYAVMLTLIPPLGLLPIFPAFWLFDRIDEWVMPGSGDRLAYLASIPIMAWPTAFVMVLVTVALIAIFRWIILPQVREGTYSVHSGFYFRKWTVALATEVTLETLSSLYATIYMRNWYRLMGAKIGKDAEISTNLSGRYDLVEIGEKCFIADEVVLGDEDTRRGWMTLRKVRTGARVFVGNDAVVPSGADIPTGSLIGIKSKPPTNPEMEAGCTWFGSPPIRLPVRQRFDTGSNWTYEPPRWKKFMRAVFEAVHISLPTMLFITFGTWAVEVLGPALEARDWFLMTVLFIACSIAISCAMMAVVIAVKWLTMGTYRPATMPMWSWWAMRTEAVAVMYWGLGARVLLDHMRGTPFLPWTLRLLGAKFGKGVWMDSTDITEFDCVKVGDYCAINALSALQTHLYEDRVMKVGRVELAAGVTVGAGSTVLYDTRVDAFAQLGPLTIVMKGEQIPGNSSWMGAPAVRMA